MDFDWTQQYIAWAILAAVFFVAAAMIKTALNSDAAVVYGTAALSVTIMLFIGDNRQENIFGRNKRRINILAFMSGAIAGSTPVMAAANYLNDDTALLIAFLSVGFLLFLQYQNFVESLKKEADNARYFSLVPMAVWLIWGVMFFKNLPVGVGWYWLIYQVGLMLFAGWATIRTFYNGDDQSKAMKISLILIAVIAIGMLLTANLQSSGLRWVA